MLLNVRDTLTRATPGLAASSSIKRNPKASNFTISGAILISSPKRESTGHVSRDN